MLSKYQAYFPYSTFIKVVSADLHFYRFPHLLQHGVAVLALVLDVREEDEALEDDHGDAMEEEAGEEVLVDRDAGNAEDPGKAIR